jgi:hypothetical protein
MMSDGTAGEPGLPRARAPFSSDAELARLTAGFLDRTLPKACWTNDAHWAVAVDLMLNHPGRDLPREMPDLIRAYNVVTGLQNTETAGYHETITQASLHMARRFLANEARGLAAAAAVNALMASPLGKVDWLLAYWTKDRLMSPRARLSWVAPDLQPLPG